MMSDSSAAHAEDVDLDDPDLDDPEVEKVGPPELVGRVVDALKQIYDPEIPLDIYQLGLIYKVEVDDDGNLYVTMTLTTPMCPEAQSMPPRIEKELAVVDGVRFAQVDVVWDPPWGPERMTAVARLTLGL